MAPVPRTGVLVGLVVVLLAAALGAPPAEAGDPTPAPRPTASPAPATEGGSDAAAGQPDAQDTAALVAASAQLAKAQAALVAAQDALRSAQALLVRAQAADRAAQVQLQAAVLAEERAARDLAVVEARIAARQRDLGRLARSAYQGVGPMDEWSLVLSATTPNQLAERLAYLRSVSTTANALIARLREDRAELVNAQARLAAARRDQEQARAAAAASLTAVSSKAQLAQAAASRVRAVVAARAAAVEQARRAALADRAQYQLMTTQSGTLAGRIVELARGLANRPRSPKGTGVLGRPGIGSVTSPYGPRFHPILRYVKLHTGTDFSSTDGIVYAADSGVVLISEYNVAYGNFTVVDHGTVGGLRITTMYAHQAASGVKPGDRVVKGQAIGVVGSTGYSTGPHLHLEVRVDGQPVDPAPFLVGAKLPPALPAAR